jgi:predicted ATPase
VTLTKLRIDNLKCFRELSLRLAPLTLLTGFNAAGKSTSVQTLLLLAQAIKKHDAGWKIALNGELVQLGTAGEALHEGAETGLVLGVETDRCKLAWHLKAEGRGQTHAMSIDKIEWQVSEQLGTFTPAMSRLAALLPNDCQGELAEIRDVIGSTVFISAIRSGTDDVYPIPTDPVPTCADVGVRGEFAAWWLEQTADEEVDIGRRHSKEEATTVRRQFNAWASSLFPGAQANATRIPSTQLVQLSWRNHETDSWRRPANIGYGLTYALPILIAGLLAKRGQILVIDSPEAHLHPMGQSNMGRFLATVAASGVQLIVETHSDHILNGIRRAVYEKTLPPNETAIHFFNSRPRCPDDYAHVISPRMDVNGSLSEWPSGFFDQAEHDMSVLAGWGN